MLAEYAGRRFTEVLVENQSGGQEIEPKIAQLYLIEQKPRTKPGHKTEHVECGADVEKQQRDARAVDQRQFGKRANPALAALGKNQGKVQEKGRRQHPGGNPGPIHLIVESVQLAAVLEGIQNEGNQAENVKMHGPRGIPAAHEDEKPYKKVKKADKPTVIFDGSGLFRRRSNDGSLKLLTIASQFVAHLVP